MRKPCPNGKEGYGVYPGVGGTLLLPPFWLALRVCSVCVQGRRGDWRACAYYFPARPGHWDSVRPCTAYSAGAGLVCYPNAGSH